MIPSGPVVGNDEVDVTVDVVGIELFESVLVDVDELDEDEFEFCVSDCCFNAASFSAVRLPLSWLVEPSVVGWNGVEVPEIFELLLLK